MTYKYRNHTIGDHNTHCNPRGQTEIHIAKDAKIEKQEGHLRGHGRHFVEDLSRKEVLECQYLVTCIDLVLMQPKSVDSFPIIRYGHSYRHTQGDDNEVVVGAEAFVESDSREASYGN